MNLEILSAGIKMRVIDLYLQDHLAISTQKSRKPHSISLLYTNLGRPRGATSLNVLLLTFFDTKNNE